MKGSTKRVFSILVSIALIIGSLLVFSSLIKPEYEEVVKKRAEVEARINARDEYKNSTKNIEKLLKEFQNIDQFKENISMVLPVDQNFPQAMNQITGLASINKINVESLSVERMAIKPTANADTVKGVGTLRMNLRLNGDYDNLRSFIGNLETNITLMDLVSLKIESGQKAKSGDGRFSYVLVVDTRYQTE